MVDKKKALPFNDGQTWSQKVLEADEIYMQVKNILAAEGKELPASPRRPDVRLIINNMSGRYILFLNPGDHSKKMPETIPPHGKERAAMVMLKGNTLEEQAANAKELVEIFDLADKGLTRKFAKALGTKKTGHLVAEAYGPAPFADQTAELVPLKWQKEDKTTVEIAAVVEKGCAYGVRAAKDEKVFMTEIVLFVKGTNTTPESIENAGMYIAVSSDWKTGVEMTRPIVPSVAKEFYGAYLENIPTVTVTPEGRVLKIDLKPLPDDGNSNHSKRQKSRKEGKPGKSAPR